MPNTSKRGEKPTKEVRGMKKKSQKRLIYMKRDL